MTITHTEERKALHAYVSDHAHATWHGYAGEHGVSVSAILEALAGELEPDSPTLGEPMWQRLDAIVRQARRIDTARRQRKP